MAGDGTADSRRQELGILFRKKYGRDVDFFAHAPGRVNLIGEHIDYHGYSVLPMALTKDILMAVSRNDSSEIHLASTQSERFSDYSGKTSDFHIDQRNPKWYHYVLCGLKGCADSLPAGVHLTGMNILTDGQVPPNAGLSSSSALVCCSALAAFQACRQEISRTALASLCAKSERHIGTEGGGMDQAISMLAQAGKAKLIDFHPLKVTDVTLPQDAVFIVANSSIELNKAATSHYNTRVVEGRVGVAIIAHARNLNWRELKKAKPLQEALTLSLPEMLTIVETTFHDSPYTIAESAKLLEISEPDFSSTFLGHTTENLEVFHIKQRLRHIFSESARVFAFQQVCTTDGDSALSKLGQLMHDSHVSCRDDYQCSCYELDDLVDCMMTAGARGARLTGAGWGGCAVALVERGREDAFLRAVQEGFYAKHGVKNVEASMFVTTPGDGAEVFGQERSVLI